MKLLKIIWFVVIYALAFHGAYYLFSNYEFKIGESKQEKVETMQGIPSLVDNVMSPKSFY